MRDYQYSSSTLMSTSSSLKRDLSAMVKESAKNWSIVFDDSDYDDDDCTAETAIDEWESDEETEIAHALVEKAFHSPTTSSAQTTTPVFDIMFRSFVAEQSRRKKRKVTHNNRTASPPQQMRLSVSEPHLPTLQSQPQPQPPRRSLSTGIPQNTVSPHEYLRQRWEASASPPEFVSFREVPESFFVPLDPCHIRAYDTTLVRAVRDQDVETLLRIQKSNTTTLHAGNKFGETILHAACRRGACSIVRFLIQQGDHPVRVCCSSGRTILHDAAWTCTPQWPVMTLLLNKCPDLLYIQDERSNTPLDYVPKEQWTAWCEYLETTFSLESLRPRML